MTLALALFCAMGNKAKAQGPSNNDNHNVKFVIPEIAFLDIEEGNNGRTVSLIVEAPEDAGDPVVLDNAIDSSLFINYTSIVGGSKRRSVSAQITSGTIPGGLNLKVAARNATTDKKGTAGSPAGSITLSTTPQTLISGIGSCFTGNGNGKGHRIVYSLDLSNNGDDFGSFNYEQNNSEVTVTYTITDDN